MASIPPFKGVRLGPHAETLRRMLNAADAGDPLDYPCILTAVTWHGRHISDLIVPPFLATMDGQHIWSFVVAGIVMTFFVSSHTPMHFPPAGFLTRNGSLSIVRREITEIDYLHRYTTEVADAQRKRDLGDAVIP